MKNYCMVHGELGGEAGKPFHFLVDMKSKIAYCKVNKIGSTTLIGFFREKKLNFLEQRNSRVNGNESDQTIHENRANFSSFLFVRHPLDRLRSAFENKFRHHWSHHLYPKLWRKIVGDVINVTRGGVSDIILDDTGTRITFREFIQYVIHNDRVGQQQNSHWRSIFELCTPCQWNYSFIGHLETFDQDMAFIQTDWYRTSAKKMAKANPSPKIQAKPLNQPMNKSFDTTLFKQLSPLEMKDIISIYAHDILAFGYDVDEFMNSVL